MVKPLSEEAYQASFDDMMSIVEATNPDGSSLVAHTFEFETRLPDASREREIEMLTGVMADDEGAVYNDSVAHKSRCQTSSGHGIIALATTALSQYWPCTLFGTENTGLLLKDATPVHVSVNDSYSHYDERKSKLLYVENIKKRITVDPLSLDVQDKAMRNYNKTFSVENACELSKYNEVCVNATLDNISGVLVRVRATTSPAPDSMSGAEMVKANSAIAETMSCALEEYDQIMQKFEDTNTVPSPPPIIVIHHLDISNKKGGCPR